VVLFSTRCGETADSFRADGFPVVDTVGELPTDVDVIHGQHCDTVASVRARLPETPLVFATHSWFISLEDPIAALGAGAFVALNDITHERLRAHAAATGVEVLRLTQPVTISFADGVRTPLPEKPRRAIAVSRRMIRAPGRLADACAEAGVAFDWVGGPDRASSDARVEMRTADIVFGVGRSALEAMAAGRATFVVDESALGGWVSPASYDALEADGFTGHGTGFDVEALVASLAGYTPELGAHARRFVLEHHTVQRHAAALVDLYTRVGGPAMPCPAGVDLLAYERFAFERRAVAAEWQAAEAMRELEETRAELAEVSAQRDRFRRQRNRARRALSAEQGLMERLRRRR
jgi:hypothetical protein